MSDGPLGRYRDLRRRVRRVERRELRQLRRWLETTSNVTHLSVVVFVPLLIAVVTLLSNTVRQVSFLLFPPLAAGTYTLFAEPEGRYASPWRFVAGMSVGGLCGWAALEVSALYVYDVPPGTFEVQPGAAALGVLLTAVVTWAVDVELPTAFSTALLVLVTGSSRLAYVLGIALSSALVAAVFVVWRDRFYEQRARYLYGTTGADDHVLVPMRGEAAFETAMLGARLAAAHDAGKVVLLAVVTDEAVAEAARATPAEGTGDGPPGGRGAGDRRPGEAGDGRSRDGEDGGRAAAERRATAEAADRLEAHADRIRERLGLHCEVAVVAEAEPSASAALDAAAEANCDLVVTPFEAENGGLTPFVRGLFRGDLDVVAFRSTAGRTGWKRVMVPVRRASDVAHAMVDYAERLAGDDGSVSICHCIDAEAERRRAESMLADLAETTTARCETRVSRSSVEAFLERNEAHYDLVLVGASTDRSVASRFLSPPTFERVSGVETDVAVVHRR